MPSNRAGNGGLGSRAGDGRALATDWEEADQTALEAGASHAAEEEAETRLEGVQEVPAEITDPAREPTASVVPPVWGREEEASAVEVAAEVEGDDKRLQQ